MPWGAQDSLDRGAGSETNGMALSTESPARYHAAMTYCVGVLLNDGIVMASDSRTHAGVDNFATFCKMTVFERVGDRVIVLLSSGNLAGTQAVISVLKQDGEAAHPGQSSIWSARTMFDVANTISNAVRSIERRDARHLAERGSSFNASFIIGGQIKGEPLRLFRTFAEGNFIEAGSETPYFQTGEAKYGKPILDRVVTRETSLHDTMKGVLISFDSTMRSNLSVGMPIDLLCIERDSLRATARQRFREGDFYFSALSRHWRDGIKMLFERIPDVPLFKADDRTLDIFDEPGSHEPNPIHERH
jgi:putative proteasome-type protease